MRALVLLVFPGFLGLLGLLATPMAQAWELAGQHRVFLHARDGSRIEVATLQVQALGPAEFSFKLSMTQAPFSDHFLSMREFKCLTGAVEILCHVPYPYAQPGRISRTDLAWLEHALLFMFKLPRDFGAKLWNGIYFKLQLTDKGLVGTPQAIDLNLIAAPPQRTDVPPYRPALRDDIAPQARWFTQMTIE